MVPILNDSSTDPLESFIINLNNLSASGSTSSSITGGAHAVYIVDVAPQDPSSEPTPTQTETVTETETIPETHTTTQTQTESQTETETQTLFYVTPTQTETLTHTISETSTSTDTLIIFPTATPRPIDPYPTCWCTPTGTTCPPRPRPSITPTSTPTYVILPPEAPSYVIVDGRCYQKTTEIINTKDLNYNHGGNFENCEDCNQTLFQISEPIPTPGASEELNAPLDTDKIYQKYVLASVFDSRHWQNLDQNSNLIYGNLLYNQEPVYGAYAFVYNKDGTLVTQTFLSSNDFNISVAHDPNQLYSITFEHEKFNKYVFDNKINFKIPGQKFSTGDIDAKNV